MKKVVVCDRGGSEDNVQKYRVGVVGGSLFTLELCGECAEPLVTLMTEHQERSKRAVFKVTPMAEVARAPRKPQKRAGGTTTRAARKRS